MGHFHVFHMLFSYSITEILINIGVFVLRSSISVQVIKKVLRDNNIRNWAIS